MRQTVVATVAEENEAKKEENHGAVDKRLPLELDHQGVELARNAYRPLSA